MSITVGGRDTPWVILIGGTGSASLEGATRVYGGQLGLEAMASAVFPGANPKPFPFVSDWPGGFPATILGSTTNPRAEGLRDLSSTLAVIHGRGVRKIGLVGFSHGGWIAMRAADQMLRASGWKGADIRLVTLSTPPLVENVSVARRLGQYVVGGSLRWLGLREADDPVSPGLAGVIEHVIPGDGRYGTESLFKAVDLPLGGIAAHDEFPARHEVRDAIATVFRV